MNGKVVLLKNQTGGVIYGVVTETRVTLTAGKEVTHYNVKYQIAGLLQSVLLPESDVCLAQGKPAAWWGETENFTWSKAGGEWAHAYAAELRDPNLADPAATT